MELANALGGRSSCCCVMNGTERVVSEQGRGHCAKALGTALARSRADVSGWSAICPNERNLMYKHSRTAGQMLEFGR